LSASKAVPARALARPGRRFFGSSTDDAPPAFLPFTKLNEILKRESLAAAKRPPPRASQSALKFVVKN
jgi:hypothetical protein